MVVTYSLIAINFIFFAVQLYDFQIITVILGLNSLLISDGFYWQLFTNMFVHGSFIHIAMNMVVLYQFGNMIEPAIRYKYFLILYIGGGLLTSILSFPIIYTLYPNTNTVGASGAISVLFGWLAYSDLSNRKGMIIAILVMTFGLMLLGLNVAWYGHFIGFGVGWVLGVIFRKINYRYA